LVGCSVIVDDEKPARERLRSLLKRDVRVDLVSCSKGGAEALSAIEDVACAGRPVQVLFLDVQMPELDGFGVIARLARQPDHEDLPLVVFVTAYDEYALRAFEAHATDYLLKPFSDERFEATLDRAIRHVRAGVARTLVSQMEALLGSTGGSASLRGVPPAATRQRPALDRIVVKGAHRVRLLPTEQISWIEADGVHVKLHTREGAVHLHRGSLTSLDAALDERRFLRVHRSAIVNIDVVDELRQQAHGAYVVLLNPDVTKNSGGLAL
jgi:two-component system, LytTR family, response regulator